ncbi:MAG: type II toxin-antitoxin system Phd/YefM family antitoxin [Chloroflexia bacterium]
MRRLGVRELKEHLSEVLDEVRDGQVIEVTRMAG